MMPMWFVGALHLQFNRMVVCFAVLILAAQVASFLPERTIPVMGNI